MKIANEKSPDVKLVFVSKAGIKYFANTDPLNLSAKRGISAERAKRYADMNLTQDELKKLIKAYKEAVVQQDIVKAHSVIQEIEYRQEFICEERSLFDLAALYFMMEGEDVDVPTDKYNALKKEAFEKEEDVKAFFLQSALVLISKSSLLPENDLLSYLEQMRMISERIYRYISPA